MTDEACTFLAWDSDFFDSRIGRLNADRLTDESLRIVLDWCATRAIQCLYFLADPNQPTSIGLAERNGFHLVDVRVTLERRIAAREPPRTEGEILVRPSNDADIPVLCAIAAVCHRDSRFYFDHNFPRSRCDALYETWIRKSCEGYADIVLVAEFEGRAAGYCACRLVGPGAGQIGLLGVDPDMLGRGLGQSLIEASLIWFTQKGATLVSVVTQGRNCKAQRAYQRSGFLTQSVELWYHKWFDNKRSLNLF